MALVRQALLVRVFNLLLEVMSRGCDPERYSLTIELRYHEPRTSAQPQNP
jgi:hypothetical protein